MRHAPALRIIGISDVSRSIFAVNSVFISNFLKFF